MDFNKFVKDIWSKIFIEKQENSIEYSLFLKNKESISLFATDIFNLQYFSSKEGQVLLEEKTINFFAFLRTVKELSLKYKYKILNEDFLREIFNSFGFYIHPLFTKEQLQQLTDVIYIYKNKGTSEIVRDVLNTLTNSTSYDISDYYLFQSNQILSFNSQRSLPINKIIEDPLWYTSKDNINVFPVKLPYFSISRNVSANEINSSLLYLYALVLLELKVFSSDLPKEINHPLLKENISIVEALFFVNSIFYVIFKDLLPPQEMIDRKIALYKKLNENISFENVSKIAIVQSLQNLFDLFDFSLYGIIADFILENKNILSLLSYVNLTDYIISNWAGYNPVLFPVINSLTQEIYPKLIFIFFYNIILSEQKPITTVLNFNWEGNYPAFITKLNYFYSNIMDVSEYYESLPSSYFLNYSQLSTKIGISTLQILNNKLFNFVYQLSNQQLTFDQKYTLFNFCIDLINKIFSINKMDIRINNVSSMLIDSLLKFLKPIYARIIDTFDLNSLNINDSLRNTLAIGDYFPSFIGELTFSSSIFTGKMFFNYKRSFSKKDQLSNLLNLNQYLLSLDNNVSLDKNYYIYTPIINESQSIYYGGTHIPNATISFLPIVEKFDEIIITDEFIQKNSSFIKTEDETSISFKSTNQLEPLFIYLTKIKIPDSLKQKWQNEIGKIKVHSSVINPTQLKGSKIEKQSTQSIIPIIDKNKKLSNPLFSSTLNLGQFISQFNDTDIFHFQNLIKGNASYFMPTQSNFIIIESTFYPTNDVPFVDFIKTKFEGYI